MGRQSSRIWYQNKDHKEMVTWNGSRFQYHNKAYIWNNGAFQLVWEKLPYGQQATSIAALKFATTMDLRESSNYFFGFDPDTPNKLIRVSKGSFNKSDLITTERTHFAGTTKDGKVLLLKQWSGSPTVFESGLFYDVDNGRALIATDVDYTDTDPVSESRNIIFPSYLAQSGGNYRNIAYRGYKDGRGYALVVSVHGGQWDISIFHCPIPNDPYGQPYTILGMTNFYNCRAVGFNANGEPHLADIQIIGSGQATKTREIDISGMLANIGGVATISSGGIDRETTPGYFSIIGMTGRVVIDWLNVTKVAEVIDADFKTATGETRLYDTAGFSGKYAAQIGQKNYQSIRGYDVYDPEQMYVQVDDEEWKQLQFDNYDVYDASSAGAGIRNLDASFFKATNTNVIFAQRSYSQGQTYLNYWQGFEF